MDALSPFSDREQKFQRRFRSMRDRILAPVLRPLVKLPIPPNAVSIAGCALLVPMAALFGIVPWASWLCLILYVVFDGLDGPYARLSERESRAGAFVDMICDHVGLIVVCLVLLRHGAAPPVLAALYMVLYVSLLAVAMAQKAAGAKVQPIFRSKYYLFLFAGLYGIWGLPGTGHLMLVCSIQMICFLAWSLIRICRRLSEDEHPPAPAASARPNRNGHELLAFWLIVALPLALLPWAHHVLLWLA